MSLSQALNQFAQNLGRYLATRPSAKFFNPFFDDVWFWTEDMGVRNVDFDTPGEACRFNDLGLSSCA